MTLTAKAKLLIEMSKNAQAAGDAQSCLELALLAAQYLQLTRLTSRANEAMPVLRIRKDTGKKPLPSK